MHFLRHNRAVNDTTLDLLLFAHLSMQCKNAASETSAKPQDVLTDEALTIALMTTQTITAFVDHPSEWNITGTVTALEKFTETATLLISFSISTIFDRKVAVRVSNTTESPLT